MRAASAVDLVRPRGGVALTSGETRYLAEYAIHGELLLAAECIGCSLSHLKRVLHNVHGKTGTMTSIGSMYRLGWIDVPVDHAA